MIRFSYKLFGLTVLLIVFYTNVYAQINKTNANGYNTFFYPNKVISAQGYMKDGKPIGYWKSYFPNGILKAEGNRKNDLLDSLWLFYNENGTLKEEIFYKNGIKSGFHIIYKNTNDSTYIISKELYIEGKLNGKSFYYDTTGILSHTVEYQNGYVHGYEKHYDKTGMLTLILKYSHNNLIDSEYLNQRDKNGLKQGIWKEFYKNEKIKIYSTFLDDTLNGYYREYDQWGNITKSLYYNRGKIETENIENNDIAKPTTIKKEFYKNGKLKSVGQIVNNVKIGTHIYYDSLGNIENAVEYSPHGIVTAEGATDIRGYKQGKWNYFYPDGKTKAYGMYTDDKRVGEWFFLYQNGTKEQIGKYTDGKPEGAWTWYFPNSAIRRTGAFSNGLEEGLFYELSVEGDTISNGKYVAGMKHGNWKYKVNDHIETGSYRYNKRDGIWNYYYPDNILEFEGNFIEGFEDGTHKFYYPNKNIKLVANYISGIATKKWKYYNPDGSIRTIVEYRAGRKYKIDGKKIEN